MKLIIIIKKELLDQIRDKRTIVASILMPAFIVPLLLFLTTQNTSKDELKAPVRIIIQSSEIHLKNIISGSFKDAEFIYSGSPAEAIKNGKADLQVDVEKTGDRYKTLTINYDSARRVSALSSIKLENYLKSYFNRPETAAAELQITASSIRSEKENMTLLTLSVILPVFLMVFAASSTMSGVIDMSSGEKERSTIETLLSCSISHTAIITGKILAASIIGFTSVLSLLSGLIICSSVYPQMTGGISILNFCGVTNLALMLVMAFLSVFLFSSAGMAIGLYAKSVKEGTILTIPVIILCSALSSGIIASDPFTVNKFYLLVPVLNFSYLIRSAIYNHHDVLLILISILVNLVYSFLFVIISRYLLKKETVIFRS